MQDNLNRFAIKMGAELTEQMRDFGPRVRMLLSAAEKELRPSFDAFNRLKDIARQQQAKEPPHAD